MSMVDPGFGNALFILILIAIGCLLDDEGSSAVHWNGNNYEETWRDINDSYSRRGKARKT